MKQLHHACFAAFALAVLVGCGDRSLTLSEFDARELELECIGTPCGEAMGLRLERRRMDEVGCKLDRDVRATQDGEPMSRGISEGCFFARWAFANTDPADVTVFEISDDTATITMQVRRAFDPRNALFLLPAVGYLRPRDRVEVHWSPPEDALTSIWITIGPPGDRKAIIDMRSIGDEPGVYRGTVEVYGALPFTEEPHLRADREPVSLVAACEGVSSCIHSSVSEAVLPAVEVRN